MITTGCFMLMVLVNYVSPVPLSKGENEDIQVMKCIVEVIADTLSKPHPLPVSQQCLDTLSTDERLVSILRHRNFLKELQDIAVEGASERAQLPESPASVSGQVTKQPLTAPGDLEANPDQSMLLAGMRPGEKREAEEDEEEEEEGEEESEAERAAESMEREAPEEEQESQESQEGNEIEGKEQERSQEEEGEEEEEKEEERSEEEEGQTPSNHISDSMNQEMESQEKGGEEEVAERGAEEEKKRSSSEEEEGDEEAVTKYGKVKDGPRETSEAKSTAEEEEEEEEKKRRTAVSDSMETKRKKGAGEAEAEEAEKRGVGAKRWSGLTHQPHALQAQRRAKVEQEEAVEGQEPEPEEEEEERRSSEYPQLQEMPHHSKEVFPGEEATPGLQRSPEERELSMMARREPDDRRDEEGSASRKPEEPEIESLAAIESELENVAQKLHELRRG
ncbi:hypothetical protein ACEWY4_021826 [Coilia grayii]|uniref:Chromogranin-A n=1 Tax=Coilia grayii TaxID=363190 RepID=A0ABD1J7T8_9TELE